MFFTGRNAAAVIAVTMGVAAAGIGAGQAGPTGGPVRCEIKTTRSGGMVTLAGVVHADAVVAGSYSFRVAGGGTDIAQGGEFNTRAGQAETLGQVMLGGRSTVYQASLDVSAGGRTYRCTERVRGS